MARRGASTPDPRLVDTRHRVCLSRAVMRALDLQAGDYVTFEVDTLGGVRLHKLSVTVVPSGR
jgi:hypothetical protein